MGPLICARHAGVSWMAKAAPAVADAVQGRAIEQPELVRLDICSLNGGRNQSIWLDQTFAFAMGLHPVAGVVRLLDRLPVERALNDRVAIVRVRRACAGVCLHCLDVYLRSRGYPMPLRKVRPLSKAQLRRFT